MARVRYVPHVVADQATGLPIKEVRGVSGLIVAEGTDTALTLTDSNNLPVTNPVTITTEGIMPGFFVEEGLTRAEWVSGSYRLPVWSPQGLEEDAAASALDASNSAADAQSAAGDAEAAAESAAEAAAVVPTGGAVGQVLTVTAEIPSRVLDWATPTGGGGGDGAVTSVAGKTGAVSLVKADVGLSNVDNTSDADKPVSTAQLSALNGKAAAVHTHAITDVTGLQSALDSKRGTNDPVDAGLLTSGTVAPARLGSGIPDNTKVLYGDGAWRVPSGSGGSITAADISDATTVGRNVLKATDAAAARTAIGAGTSSLVIGTTSTTAKAGNYAPAAADITNSTAVGRALIVAADAAAGRTAIGAAASQSIADLPAGSVLKVAKSSGTWPARPTTRTDITVMFVGAEPAPAIVSSPSTGGMYEGDIYLKTGA